PIDILSDASPFATIKSLITRRRPFGRYLSFLVQSTRLDLLRTGNPIALTAASVTPAAGHLAPMREFGLGVSGRRSRGRSSRTRQPIYYETLALSRADRGQSESMDVDQLLTLRPMLQRDHLGQPAYWAVAEDVAKLLDQIVSPGCRTLETGAGVSTVIFALKGAHHTCVVPDAKLVERIIAFCRDAEINTEKLRFEVAPSQDILPRLSLIDLDVVLIDGAHAFPIPFLDWFYAARTGLREGGTLIIDD